MKKYSETECQTLTIAGTAVTIESNEPSDQAINRFNKWINRKAIEKTPVV